MKLERRVVMALAVFGALAVPAAVLRVLCIGQACVQEEAAARKVPFCSLPAEVREGIAAGYREGRSPDILGVTRKDVEIYSGGVDAPGDPWPSVGRATAEIPVVFVGHGIEPGADLPSDFGLDDISPTLADVIGFEIPHPEVRSGRAATEAVTGERPRLIALIVLRGVVDAETDPVLAALADKGATTMTASPGSLPLDTTALMTTIGTGGVPSEHGITGTIVKNESGRAVRAWREPAPGSGLSAPWSVIATLADDLDEELRQRPNIALVADTAAARGLVGGNWYVDNDRDRYRIVESGRVPAEVRSLLRSGFGDDDVVDLIGISMHVSRPDGATEALHLFNMLRKATGDRAAAAVIALPRMEALSRGMDVVDVIEPLARIAPDLVEADTAGGIFLDQAAFARADTSKDEITRALRSSLVNGVPVFADVFPDLAVSFARFC